MIRQLARRLFAATPRLSQAALEESRQDRLGLPLSDPGTDQVIARAMDWLARAQDHSSTRDGGVARDYSLLHGWASSYPETTGYIVPTFIDYARLSGDADARARAHRMLRWLTGIQLACGGFQGGKVDMTPVVPVTFNTGQILIGLVAGVREFGAYREAMRRAADWLVQTQDKDGCWRRHSTPFAAPGEKSYETHVAWGLFEAARIDSNRGYAEAAMANVRWAMSRQTPNGWMRDCCLGDPARPLTHTLGYALRGMVEAYRFSEEPDVLASARRLAAGLMGCMAEDGGLPGRIDAQWRPCVSWVCLTGNVQIAHSWLLLYEITGDVLFRDAAFRANSYVRRTIHVDGDPNIAGAVKGSFPIDGDYGAYQFLNWGAKFCVDAQMLERHVQRQSA